VLDDIVIDTNVLEHARNPGVGFFTDAVKLLKRLLDVETKWCLDEGSRRREAWRGSRMYGEYVVRLVPGDLGLSVLTQLALTERVRLVPRPARQVREAIARNVHDPSDRVFAEVAFGSNGRTLVTHDDAAFTVATARWLRRQLSVDTVDAGRAFAALSVGGTGTDRSQQAPPT